MASRAGSAFSLVVLLVACGGSDRDDDKAHGSTAGVAGTRANGAGGASGHGGTSGGAGKANAARGGVAGVGTSAGGAGNGGKVASGGRATMTSGGASAANGGAKTGGVGNAAGASTSGGQGEQGGASDTGGDAGAAGSSTGAVTYSTSFDAAESPLSEGGVWHHDGLDWTIAETANGIARGTQALGVERVGAADYNDSYAYLAGFPADQQASAVIALGSIDTTCTHEVEVLLRWADSAHNARGYECNVAYDGSYAQIVRWNGPLGDYTYVGSGNVPGGIHDGDTVSASIVGDSITLSVNGTVRATASDATFTTGNPGVGFWRGENGCGTLGDYGFTSFTASGVVR